ncbi:hypothetical protein SPTER_15460 [Sporomusa termitida]|uniref:Phage major capsid protein E n=2 Tax=Sporomusa termitida TaxID=2377 RepID=A0A517DSD3_9FIRM|nr:hypothetical protein SPTER_15460 [Sporomusa termitida]
MAKGSHSYTTVGTVEDISDIITNIAPDDTPLLTMFGKGKADNTTVSELNDALPTPQNDPQLEGSDYVPEEVDARSRIDNHTQIFDRVFFITTTQKAVKKYGVKDEVLYQLDKYMKGIAMDLEAVLVTSDSTAQHTASVPGRMGGIPYFNTVNVIDTSTRTPASVFDEEGFNDAIEKAWTAGGNPKIAVMSMSEKRKANNTFGEDSKTSKQRGQKDKKVIGPIDFYESDAGVIKLMPHRMINRAVDPETGKLGTLKTTGRRVEIIDPQYFKPAFLIPFHVEELGKKGKRFEKAISGEVTLRCRSKEAHAAMTGIGTAG